MTMNIFLKFAFSGLLLLSFDSSAQLPAYVPQSNLLAFYPFSGNVIDASGNGHNNANYNVVATTDRFNTIMRALHFSNSGTEYLNFGDVADFEGWIQLSFSFWLVPESFGGDSPELFKPIISKWSTPNDALSSSYLIGMNSTDLEVILTDGFTSDTIRTPLNLIGLNNWTHIVITTNYGFVKVYINGVLVTDESTIISFIRNSSSEFKVGGWRKEFDANFQSYHGKIDDLGLWNKELDACEVEALYSGINCPTSGIDFIQKTDAEPIRIVDQLGRPSEFKPNSLLFYQYEDGTIVRRMTVE